MSEDIVLKINADFRNNLKGIIYSNKLLFGNLKNGVVFSVSLSNTETVLEYSESYKIFSIEHSIEILESLCCDSLKENVRQRVNNILHKTIDFSEHKDMYLICHFRKPNSH